MIHRMYRAITAFCIAVLFPQLVLAKAPEFERTAPWNAETSDMEPDSRIIYGRLKNGLRYAIRPNPKPENQVLIRMVLDFGSAAESDDEQGLAHFIEHMAFNGTTNVPEGEMVRMLERLGLAFGADTNASTGYHQTMYQLDLPRKDPGLIERAMFLMRETASEVQFNPEAVNRERGVVLSEMRDGENFGFKRMRESFRLFYPDSFYINRIPIGKKEVLEKATAGQMKALYRKYYVPDRARIVVVGPVDPVAIEREIARKFGNWQGSGASLGKLKQCTFDTRRQAESAIFVHPEIDEAVNVEQIVPDTKRPDTIANNLQMLKMQVAWGIVSDRLTRLSRKEDIPFLGAGPNFEPGFCDKYARVGYVISAKDGGWRAVLPVVEQAIRQSAQHGFTTAEMDEQLKRFDAAYANAVKSEPTTPSGAFAGELAGNETDVINSAAYRQLAWLQMRPFLSAEAVRQEFAYWYGKIDRPQLFLSTRKGEQVENGQLLAAYNASRAMAVSPPAQRDTVRWAYTQFGPQGKVASDTRIDDLGIRTVRFENGVMLNIKSTDFEADRVRFTMRVDGGRMLYDNDALPLISLMNGAFVSGGLGKHGFDDLRALLAGTTAAPGLAVGEDHFGASGAVVPNDLGLQLQLLAAYLTDPGYRDEAVRLFRRPIPESYARLDATPGSALGNGANKILHEGDPRFNIVPMEKLMEADFPALKNLVSDALVNNRLEIGIVGKIEEETAIALVAQTLGALPKRLSESSIQPGARVVQHSAKTGTHDLFHRGEPNQMAWRRIWLTTDSRDQKLTGTMALLAEIVQIRLLDELREKLGAAYSANAGSTMFDNYPGRGYFTISTNGDPKNLAAIELAVDTIIAEIAANPPEADLFARAQKPILESYRDWRKRNSSWMGVVAEAQTDSVKLDRFRASEQIFRTITADDVWKAAQRFLKDRPSYAFRALPQSGTQSAVTAP
jgi:zinc protease